MIPLKKCSRPPGYGSLRQQGHGMPAALADCRPWAVRHDARPLAASRRGLKGLRRYQPTALGGLGLLFRVRLWSWPRPLSSTPAGGSQYTEPVIGGS